MNSVATGITKNEPVFKHGMWRVVVDGRQYCAADRDDLINHLDLRKPPPDQPAPTKPTGLEDRKRIKQFGSGELSWAAKALVRKMGKDFDKITHEEIIQHVSDLVLRKQLILEMSDRFTL